MKKVLILDGSRYQTLSEDHSLSLNQLKNFLNKQNGYICETADIQHVALVVKKNRPKVLVDTSEPIENFDFVIFRNASRFAHLAAPVCLFLQKNEIPFANGEMGPGGFDGKIAQMFLFVLAGLSVPDTVVIRNREALHVFLKHQFSAGQKLIVKDNLGIRGKRNYLVNSIEEVLWSIADSEADYLVQPFIPNNGDYRVLFMGYEDPPIVIKRAASGSSHLNNVSQGSRAEMVEPSDFPQEALELARNAARIFEREIAGVDVIFDQNTGLPMLLEVNETPAIASGFSMEHKMKKLDTYIRGKLAIK